MYRRFPDMTTSLSLLEAMLLEYFGVTQFRVVFGGVGIQQSTPRQLSYTFLWTIIGARVKDISSSKREMPWADKQC